MRKIILFILFFIGITFLAWAGQKSKKEILMEMAKEQTLMETLPLGEKDIERYKNRINETNKAIKSKKVNKFLSRTVKIDLSPGFVPEPIYLVPGFSTSLVFFDITGKPFPIKSYVLPENFFSSSLSYNNEKPVKEEEKWSNTIIITPKSDFILSNLVITLQGAELPIVIPIKVSSDFRKVDFCVSYTINKRGVFAEMPVISNTSFQVDKDNILLKFIDNTPPQNAKLLSFMQGNVYPINLYEYQNDWYVRLPKEIDLVFPAYEQIANSSSVKVYKISRVPELVISIDGEIKRLTIKEETS